MCDFHFARDPERANELKGHLDEDGLPYPGQRLTEGDPFYCFRNDVEGTYQARAPLGGSLFELGALSENTCLLGLYGNESDLIGNKI